MRSVDTPADAVATWKLDVVSRRISRVLSSNIALLAMAYGLSAIANFMLTLVVGRTAGAAALGELAIAVATARTFYAASDLGVAPHLTRELAREPALTAGRTSVFVSFRLATTLGAVALTAIARPPLFTGVMAAIGLITVQSIFEAALLAHGKQRAVAGLTAVASLLVCGASVAWAATDAPLSVFGLMYCAAALAGAALWAAWTTSRLRIRLRLAIDRSGVLWAELRRSWPIGASVLLGIGALRLPVLLLGNYAGRQDVGTFSAVDTVVTAASILQVAVSNATLPGLAKAHRTDASRFRSLFASSNAILAVAGIVVSFGLSVAGVPVLRWLFPTKDFSGIVEIVPIVGWSTPCLLLVHHNIYICTAANRERLNLRLMALWFGIIAVLEVALIPRFGVIGAAWGVLIGRLVGLGAVGTVVWRQLLERRSA